MFANEFPFGDISVPVLPGSPRALRCIGTLRMIEHVKVWKQSFSDLLDVPALSIISELRVFFYFVSQWDGMNGLGGCVNLSQ